jgi:hypothetical protein
METKNGKHHSSAANLRGIICGDIFMTLHGKYRFNYPMEQHKELVLQKLLAHW